MPHHVKHIIAIVIAASALAGAVTGASASLLSLSNQNIRATWSSLQLGSNISEVVIACETTIEGSFHSSTIAKTSGLLIGYITRSTVRNPCTGGTGTIHTETLPWHIRYRGFAGSLPNISSLTLGAVGVSFEIREAGGNTCSARSETLHPVVFSMALNTSTHVAEALAPDPNARIPLTNGSGGIFCGLGEGRLSGESQTLTQLGSTASFSVTLIGEPPPVTLEPSSVAFGRLEPSQLALRTVTITAGSSGNTVNRISMERANYFAITDPNRCVGARLAERARCSFKVVFVAPAEAGRELRDTLTVEATGGNVRDTVEGST